MYVYTITRVNSRLELNVYKYAKMLIYIYIPIGEKNRFIIIIIIRDMSKCFYENQWIKKLLEL